MTPPPHTIPSSLRKQGSILPLARRVTYVLSVFLLGVSGLGMAQHFVKNSETYYILKRESLTNPQQDAYRHFPFLIRYHDPENPTFQATLRPFAIQLCATKLKDLKDHNNQNTWNQLKEDGVVHCTQNIPYAQGGGLNIDDGILTGVTYTVRTEQIPATISQEAFYSLFRYPVFYQIPIRGDRMLTFLEKKQEKQKQNRGQWIHHIWTQILKLLDRDVGSQDALDGLGAWLKNPTDIPEPMRRLILKYATMRGVLILSHIYQQIQGWDKPSFQERLTSEYRWPGFTEGVSFVTEMTHEIVQWQAIGERMRAFRNKGALATPYLYQDWETFQGCEPRQDPESQDEGQEPTAFFDQWMEKVASPWFCRVWHLVYGLNRQKLSRTNYATLEEFNAFVNQDVLAWVKDVFGADETIRTQIESIASDVGDPWASDAYVNLVHFETRVRNSFDVSSALSAMDVELKSYQNKGEDLRAYQLAPGFLKDKTQEALLELSQTVVGTWAEQQRSRLLSMTRQVVFDPNYWDSLKTGLGPAAADPVNLGWVEDDLILNLLRSGDTVPGLFSKMPGYVPRVLSLARHNVLSHVVGMLRELGAVSAAQKQFLETILNAQTVLSLLFGKQRLNPDLLNAWTETLGPSRSDVVVSLKPGDVLKVGEDPDVVSGLANCYLQDPTTKVWQPNVTPPECAVARQMFVDGVSEGMDQVAWLVQLYAQLVDPEFLKRVSFQDPVAEDHLFYDWKKGPFVVETFEGPNHPTMLIAAQEKTLRPFELLKSTGNYVNPTARPHTEIAQDPYSDDEHETAWHRLDLEYDQVIPCHVGQSDDVFCVKWQPEAFAKVTSGEDHQQFEWFRSPVGLVGRTAVVTAMELEPKSSEYTDIIEEIISPHGLMALYPKYDQRHLYWWRFFNNNLLGGLDLGVDQGPRTIGDTIMVNKPPVIEFTDYDDIPRSLASRVLKVHSKSFSPDGTQVAHVIQYFVVYETNLFSFRKKIPADHYLDKDFEPTLHMLTSTRITVHNIGASKPTVSYMSQWQRFVYPTLYGYRQWPNVGRLLYHFVRGFQDVPFQEGSHTKRFDHPKHRHMNGDEENQAFPEDYVPRGEKEIHDLRVRKWHPFSHHHYWMAKDHQVTFNIGGHIYVVDERGIRYRSDGFDQMGSRFVETPLSDEAIVGGSHRADPAAEHLASMNGVDPTLSKLSDVFDPFYHLPLGFGLGFLPPIGVRHWLAGKITNTLLFGLALPKLIWEGDVKLSYDLEFMHKWTEGLPYVEFRENGKTASPWHYHTIFPQIKMTPTWPYHLKNLSDHETYWDVAFGLFGHLKGAQESYRTYALFQDDGVEVLWNDGRFVVFHVRARSDQIHMAPDNLWLPERSYLVFVPLDVLQAHPNILQLAGWHEGGGGPFHVFFAEDSEMAHQYDCVGQMPYCRYNPRVRALAVGNTSTVFAFSGFPAGHIELAQKARDEHQSVFATLFGVWNDTLEGYEEEYGPLSNRYQQYLVVADGLSGHGISSVPFRKVVWLGEGLKGDRFVDDGESVLFFNVPVVVPWMTVIESMAASGGAPQ